MLRSSGVCLFVVFVLSGCGCSPSNPDPVVDGGITPEGQVLEGLPPEGALPEGQVIEGVLPEGQILEGTPPEGEDVEGEREGEVPPTSPPTDFRAIPSVESVLLRWQVHRSPYVSGYNVYRSDSVHGSYLLVNRALLRDTRINDRSLQRGNEYFYKVSSVTNDGEGTLSEAVSAVPGAIKLNLPVMALKPGNLARIPVNVENADGISPADLSVTIQFDPNVLDAGFMHVERTALTSHAAFTTEINVAASTLTVSAGDLQGEMRGSGKLFDIYPRPVSNAEVGAAGDISFGPVEFSSASGGSIPVNLGEKGQVTISNTGIRGDVTGDGVINQDDVDRMLQLAVSQVEMSDADRRAGDLNGDGLLDAADAVVLKRMSTGLLMNPTGPDAMPLGDVLSGRDPISITVASGAGRAGDLIGIPVSISDARGLCGYSLAISYPATALMLENLEGGSLTGAFTSPAISNTPGYVEIASIASSGLQDDERLLSGEMIVLHFRIKNELALGDEVPIILAEANLFGQCGERFDWYADKQSGSGRITVSSNSTATGLLTTVHLDATPVLGLRPLTVQYAEEINWGAAGGGIKLYDFGDGFISALGNPVHVYQDKGVFTTTVIVSTVNGNVTAAQTIVVDDPPVASFTAVNTNGPMFAAQFTDTTQQGILEIQRWSWNFGDGETSAEPNPLHSFITPGNHQVSLTVTTALAEHSVTKEVAVIGAGMVAGEQRTFAGMVFRWCPPGTFIMGSPEAEWDRISNEGPQHQVTLTKGFWMSETEITQAQWVAVMESKPSYSKLPNYPDDTSRPEEMVSWDDICTPETGYLAKLNEANPGYCFRLPTEAEWEYAYRAGTTQRFYWGDDPDYTLIGNYAWYVDNSSNATHPVGTKTANAWGLKDMNGNVWEWCSDWYGDYSSGAVTDPSGSSNGSERVLRGGCYHDDAYRCRAALRSGALPYGFNSNIGFRLVVSGATNEN